MPDEPRCHFGGDETVVWRARVSRRGAEALRENVVVLFSCAKHVGELHDLGVVLEAVWIGGDPILKQIE